MISVDLDITVLIQMVNFLFALVILNFVLIKPIRGIIKQRRDAMNSMINESETFNNLADTRIKNYEAELDAAREQAAIQKEAIRQQGVDTEQGILSAAQNDAQNLLQKSRREVSKEVEDAMLVLRSQVGSMAEKAVSRLLN